MKHLRPPTTPVDPNRARNRPGAALGVLAAGENTYVADGDVWRPTDMCSGEHLASRLRLLLFVADDLGFQRLPIMGDLVGVFSMGYSGRMFCRLLLAPCGDGSLPIVF
jgi:hypothetical protein